MNVGLQLSGPIAVTWLPLLKGMYSHAVLLFSGPTELMCSHAPMHGALAHITYCLDSQQSFESLHRCKYRVSLCIVVSIVSPLNESHTLGHADVGPRALSRTTDRDEKVRNRSSLIDRISYSRPWRCGTIEFHTCTLYRVEMGTTIKLV